MTSTRLQTALRMEYATHDPASNDIVTGDFTIDGAWHELDLDSFVTVPNGAIGFFAKAVVRDTGPNYELNVRHTSQSNEEQRCPVNCQVANVYIPSLFLVPLDGDNKFDYRCSAGLNECYLTVLWWIFEK